MRVQQGFFIVEQTCTTCAGSGMKIVDPCSSCRGEGRTMQKRSVKVKIPAGVDTESRVRVTGQGEAGLRGGPSGDLYLFVNLKEHRFYKREKNNLYCSIPIKMTVAILGGQIEILGIDNQMIALDIPAGTQSGSKVRVRNKGMSLANSTNRGDLYAQVQVETPVKLTNEQRKLIEQFASTTTTASHPNSESFITRMKNLWSDITK